jgi:2-pyrone-4,6-dicarboxylate lactonase
MPDASPSYLLSPSKPRLELPAGACDTHVHVFGPRERFPFPPEATYIPPADAPKERLFALHALLGVKHCVIVQSACHGFDNAAAADALAAKKSDYLGVALVRPDVADAELRRLHAQGFRGVRFNFMKHLGKGAPIEEVIALSRRLADLGWHLQIHMESSLIEEMSGALERSAVPVVIDHMGRMDAGLGLGQPAFRALRALMRNEKFHVKVSGSERISRRGPPYADAVPFARTLVAEFGDRVFWGTDWPHPNLPAVPDDGVLTDLLAEIAPAEAARRVLLVDNPRRFYGFGK